MAGIKAPSTKYLKPRFDMIELSIKTTFPFSFRPFNDNSLLKIKRLSRLQRRRLRSRRKKDGRTDELRIIIDDIVERALSSDNNSKTFSPTVLDRTSVLLDLKKNGFFDARDVSKKELYRRRLSEVQAVKNK